MSQLSHTDPNALTNQQGQTSLAIAKSPQVPSDADAELLHPALKSALDCLDVDLEEELSRYRCHCLRQKRLARQRKRAKNSAKGLRTQPPLPPSSIAVSLQQSQDAAVNELAIASVAATTPENMADAGVMAVSNPDDIAANPLPTNPEDYLESSAELLRSLEKEEQRAKAIAAETDTTEETTPLWASVMTPLGVGSILLMILSSATLGYLILRPSTLETVSAWFAGDQSSVADSRASGNNNQQPGLSNLAPDLASGEFAPLRPNNLSSLPPTAGSRVNVAISEKTEASLDDATPDSNAVASVPTTSPLGTNNNSGTAAPAPSRSSAVTSTPARVTPSVVTPPATATTPPPSSSPAPVVSSSANEESVTVPSSSGTNDLAINASTVDAANPAITVDTADGTATAPLVVTPVAAAEPEAAAAGGSANVPISSAPVKEDLYYVTTPYTGDQSLSEARGAVSGSYLRNFPDGTQVQMGAFSSESGAEAMIQNLQNQGISAEIYDAGDDNQQ